MKPQSIALAVVALALLACLGGPSETPEPEGPRAPRVQDETTGDASTREVRRPRRPRARPALPSLEPDAVAVGELPPASAEGEGTADPDVRAVRKGSEVLLNRKTLERDLAGVESLGEVIGVRPNLTLRGIDGFKVTALPPDSPLAGIGLEKGDVVHSVNGRKLSSLDAAFQLGAELEDAERLEGVITRNGKRRTLVVRLE